MCKLPCPPKADAIDSHYAKPQHDTHACVLTAFLRRLPRQGVHRNVCKRAATVALRQLPWVHAQCPLDDFGKRIQFGWQYEEVWFLRHAQLAHLAEFQLGSSRRRKQRVETLLKYQVFDQTIIPCLGLRGSYGRDNKLRRGNLILRQSLVRMERQHLRRVRKRFWRRS